jgi:hypothetical protein
MWKKRTPERSFLTSRKSHIEERCGKATIRKVSLRIGVVRKKERGSFFPMQKEKPKKKTAVAVHFFFVLFQT